MVIQLNLDYVRSYRGMIVIAETAFGLIGALVTIAAGSDFWSLVFWSTLIVSGTILSLNIVNTCQALHVQFSFLTKVEFGYVAVWALLYLIGTIISFVPTFWTGVAVIGYVELAIFLLDGFLHFREYRSGGGGGYAPPADAETGY